MTAKGLIKRVKAKGHEDFTYRKLQYMHENGHIPQVIKDDSGRYDYLEEHFRAVLQVLKTRKS